MTDCNFHQADNISNLKDKTMDKIIRGITANKHIRFFGTDSTETLRELVKIHNLSITASVIAGRLISAALMMGMDLKSEKDNLTLKITGDGSIGNVIVTAGSQGSVKGYLNNPQAELERDEKGRINVSGAIGSGTLTVIKDLGLKHPYVGQIELVTSEIAEDLAYYYVKSEQIPSATGLGVLVEPGGGIRKSGGFIVQLMPNTPEETIAKLEENLRTFPNFTDMMDMGHSAETLLKDFILKGFDAEITEEKPAFFKCDCSKEKFKSGITLLSDEELEKIIENKETLTTECHFCNKKFVYDTDEIARVLFQKTLKENNLKLKK
ncbi:MAG: Hsp33 family molecular chaperone HslO [Candidatus Cloacimonadota bacterium]|nr:MAG: Hsp33 family molecular chaperone HslO [Candidatus Cloacimonadota bacterium]